MPALANRIVMAALAALVLLGCAVVGVSAAGVFSPAPAALDADSYVLPLPSAVAPADGLSGIDPTLTPDAQALRTALDSLDRSRLGTVSVSVTDLNGTPLIAEDADTGRFPASSWKILTSLAVLTGYGPDHRFATTVVSSASGIVLVGGGDPYLTDSPNPAQGQASLRDLADQTAQALIKVGRMTISVGYDDTLFAGAQWNPAWPPDFAVDVAPISALSADPDGDSTSNTSRAAADTFRDLLVAQGINVTVVQAEKAVTGADTIAQAMSWPLGQIVRQVINTSNNFGAEVLFRHVAVAASLDGSAVSAQSALATFLRIHSLWTDQMQVSDGSGLSYTDVVPASVLAAAVRMAYADASLHDILIGLPVAGVDGTLSNRFNDQDEAAGRGVVHAKTGTNDNVRTLTGFTQTSSGAVVVFSFMLNDLQDEAAGVDWLDQAASALASA
ncbi:MAG: D-alanyl-D-alanine carboxypeptidase/D-alanyl-D-alanine-endopeptidase [Propionibacteriaceae bacterium]|nr:D-alanyl-D-alanine carboxypeptidase/D-alanyl-D-alanine-endopeptidase [Propionibacteriaceae bacterium]